MARRLLRLLLRKFLPQASSCLVRRRRRPVSRQCVRPRVMRRLLRLRVLTSGTPLTTSDRRAVRQIPMDTPILVEQVNPKKPSTQSFDRYEAYKGATTVGEFLARTPKRWADFANDFEKGYVSVPATAIMAVLPAFLVMALDAESAFLCSDWAPVPVPLPRPDQPLVFALFFGYGASLPRA